MGKTVSVDNLAKLKFSIWKDYAPPRILMLHQDTSRVPIGGEDNLQQEIYSWQMREDPFGGIADDHIRENLRELLVSRFDPSLPPAERQFSFLKDFLAEAEKAIKGEHAEWTVSQDSSVEDEEFPSQINPLLALKLQLDWLFQCFSNHPGISVSVR